MVGTIGSSSRPRGGVSPLLLCWAHLYAQARRSHPAISASDRQLVGAIASYINHTRTYIHTDIQALEELGPAGSGGHLTGTDGHLAFSTFGVALWRWSRNRVIGMPQPSGTAHLSSEKIYY